ncbi:hypothetical protein K504DRAFT_467643 [Pleomassaria siparia CBS 279.74]|uniref:Arb2 domain-containing protein n=1 Tax=Pleomassaria siparia CBS 279.74 TaxID=1314801 RepID=A0A6G1KB73_9PLEO|nr:hypothetical protein K504DRAFT_467643 [Pleomassaria siparia CBS 279.74]
MFRRKEEGLPPDATYPADLKQLGYFINEAGQTRMIEYPDKEFQYYLTNIERHNDVHREAFQICQREEVFKRLSAIGIEKLYLPTLSNTKPDSKPHIPILAPPADILKTRKRVIVIVNSETQDLGILAYRQLQREPGLNGGSVVDLAKKLVKRSGVVKEGVDIFRDGAAIENKSEETPGLIVLNLGQLLYSHKSNESLSLRSWLCKPRKSICHDYVKIHDTENYVEGHRTPQEHIKTVFDMVLHNTDFVAADAEIYVIAIENGVDSLVDVLSNDLNKYGARITALAVIQSMMEADRIHDPKLKAFLHQRARQWKLFDDPNPRQCAELPKDYTPGVENATQTKPAQSVNWLDNTAPQGPVAVVLNLLDQLVVKSHPSDSKLEPESTVDYSDFEYEPICTGFGGGEATVGECIFTDTDVQDAILAFFEEVAQNPSDYRNPLFSTKIPAPTIENPLTLTVNASDTKPVAFQPHPMEMTLEQEEVDSHKQELDRMKASLSALPTNITDLEKGRLGLERRIAKAEAELTELQMKALATGGVAVGEMPELQEELLGENWEPKPEGPKVSFLGAEVDSNLLKGAGLFETANRTLGDSTHE